MSTERAADPDNAGRRTSMTDGSGTETRGYDNADRLTSVTRGTRAFAYGYDNAGRVTSRTYPGATANTYAYTDDGQLASTTSTHGTTTYAYDPAGRLDTTTLPNGIVEDRGYDNGHRLTDITADKNSTNISSFAYTHDDAGNPLSRVANTGTQTYTYDPADRLTSVCHATTCTTGSTAKTTWTYDRIGNRLTETVGTDTRTNTHNAADQLTSSTLSSVSTTYTHDANGNQTAAGNDTFTYDTAGHMTTATVGADTHNYSYDGDGKRLETATTNASGTTETHAEWDITQPVPEVAAERDANDAVTRRYTYGLDRLTTTNGGTTSIYLADALGSVTNATSAAGAKQWTYDYEPYGTKRGVVHDDTAAPAQPIGYTGEHQDPTGLYHLRARQYDTTTGRFNATDPLSPDIEDPYVSSYIYVNQRPGALVDPTGEKGREIGASGATAIVSGGSLWGTLGGIASVPVGGAAIASGVGVGVVAGVGIWHFDAFGVNDTLRRVGANAYDINAPDAATEDENRNPPPVGPGRTRTNQNSMRVQLQVGKKKTHSKVAVNNPVRGVTVTQVQAKLGELFETTSSEAPWFPMNARRADYVTAIIRLSQGLERFPPGGISRSGSILREEFMDGPVKYRVDVENLWGHNLRSR